MAIIAKNKSSEYSLPPEGLWPAVCCDVVDLGDVESQWGVKPMVRICWMLEESDEKSGKRYVVASRFTLSLHKKSRLRPQLEAWRGRKFTDDELKGFDLEKLLGVNCQVQVIHSSSQDGGETYANVQAVVPAPRGYPKVLIEDGYVRFKDRPENGARNGDGQLSDADRPIDDDDLPF